MLLITEFIAKHELKPLLRFFTLKDLWVGSEKVLKHLGVALKTPRKMEGFKFYKVRIGQSVKGRMIVFVVTANNKVVPLLIRLKKDKIFGMNMSMNNEAVLRMLNKNLDHVLDDIAHKRYREIDF